MGDGRASIQKIEQAALFDIDHTYNEIEFRRNDESSRGATSEAVYLTGRRIVLNRCVAPYFLPTVCERVILNECTQTGPSEIDKLIDRVEIHGGTYGGITSATSVLSLRAVGATFRNGYQWNPRVLELIDCNVSGLTKVKEGYGFTERLEIERGTHESLPIYTLNASQSRSVTLNGIDVRWDGSILTIEGLDGSYSKQNFCAGCFVGQVVHVVDASAGHVDPTGCVGTVKETSGATNTARIRIEFSGSLRGSEMLAILGEPHMTSIRDVVVAGALTNREYLQLPFRSYNGTYRLSTKPTFQVIPCLGFLTELSIQVERPYTGSSARNSSLRIRSVHPGPPGDRLDVGVDLRAGGTRRTSRQNSSGWLDRDGESRAPELSPRGEAHFFFSAFSVNGPQLVGSEDQMPVVHIQMVFSHPAYRSPEQVLRDTTSLTRLPSSLERADDA